MDAQNGDDIPLASSLRGSYYKNHLFMGWYFSRRALGYSPEMTAQVIAAQGIHRETARNIRLDCGLYRYCGSRYLLYESVSTAQASHKSQTTNYKPQAAEYAPERYFSLVDKRFNLGFSLKN